MQDQYWHLEQTPFILFASLLNPELLAAAQIAGQGQGGIFNEKTSLQTQRPIALYGLGLMILFILSVCFWPSLKIVDHR